MQYVFPLLGSSSSFIPLQQVAGGRNVPAAVTKVAKASIDQSRQMRYRSLNEYRKHFLLKPFKSFEELTGKQHIALLFIKEREGSDTQN